MRTKEIPIKRERKITSTKNEEPMELVENTLELKLVDVIETKEEVKNVDPPKETEPTINKVLYKKIGKGSFMLDKNTIIKPEQTFYAFPHQIPAAFRDLVVPINETEAKKEKESGKVFVNVTYSLKPVDNNLFVITNTLTGKELSEPLTKEKAEAIVKQLSTI